MGQDRNNLLGTSDCSSFLSFISSAFSSPLPTPPLLTLCHSTHHTAWRKSLASVSGNGLVCEKQLVNGVKGLLK